MADLTITPADIKLAAGNSRYETSFASVALTAGDLIYKVSSSDTWALAQCDGTTEEAGLNGLAICLSDAAADQPVVLLRGGDLDGGFTVVVGTVYVVSDTAGKIMPIADLTTTDEYLSIVGYGTSANTLSLAISITGIQIA